MSTDGYTIQYLLTVDAMVIVGSAAAAMMVQQHAYLDYTGL